MSAEGTVEGVEEQVSLRVVRREEEGFPIVGELEAGPVRFRRLHLLGGEVGPHVEGRKGRLVVVPQVVEEDAVRGGRGDGDDRRGRVVGGEVRRRQVQARLRGRRGKRPQAHRVVERGREERVRRRAQAQRRHGLGVAPEVAQEGVVVRGEVADAVVLFRARVDDGRGVVREAGEVGAVLLAHERLYVLAFFGVVQEEGVVGAGGQAEFARVVEVEGCDGGFGFGEFELLVRGVSVGEGGIDRLGKGKRGSYLGWAEGPYDFGGLLGELWSSWRRWWDYEGAGHCERPQARMDIRRLLSRI